MSNLFIPILVGTKREQRLSIIAARLVVEVGNSIDGVETLLVDPNDFNFAGDGNDSEGKDPKYTEIVQRADAFFIVTPEYNHSFPGTLKRMLDSELRLYIHKPVALAGVSNGQWGGVRAIESLLSPLRTMGFVTTFSDMQFPKVQEAFDEQGNLIKPEYRDYILKSYEELIWMAKVLKYGRDNIESKYHQPGVSTL